MSLVASAAIADFVRPARVPGFRFGFGLDVFFFYRRCPEPRGPYRDRKKSSSVRFHSGSVSKTPIEQGGLPPWYRHLASKRGALKLEARKYAPAKRQPGCFAMN